MQNEGLKRRLTATFAEEAQERARALERDLLSLETSEAADRNELFRSLFRDAHSLKGAAGLLQIHPIESACHHMEELFAAARDGRLALDNATIELLLAVTDAIAEAARRLSDGSADLGSLSELTAQMVSAASVVPPADAVQAEEQPAATAPETAQARPGGEDQTDSYSRKGSWVRVPAERLDALSSESGELLAARYRSRTRTDQIAAMQELTRARRVERASSSRRAPVAGPDPSFASKVRPEQSTSQSLSIRMRSHHQDSELLLRLDDGLQQLGTNLAEDYRIIDKAATALDGNLRQARMQPFYQSCEGLDRLVRDLGRSSGKSIRLVIEGGEVEIDRSILEKLPDVLRHLVRNAVGHGLEPVEERRAAGKPEIGQVRVAATVRGDRVQVSVADDGRGLNLESIREQMSRNDSPETADEREILRSVFLPSFSTSSKVTHVSGRGVGLDIVKSTVEEMRGTIDVTHVAGRGATFTLTLPLTLTIIRALLLSTGGQIFAIDTTSVDRLIRCSKGDIRSIEGRPAILSPNGPMAVLELADWLGLPVRANHRSLGKVPTLILNIAGREVAILVEEVLAEQDLVVRGLGPRLSGMRRYAGGTILPDGRVALVLNAATLAEGAVEQRGELGSFLDEAQPGSQRRVLVADDSVTIRTLQKSILEAAGYDVTVASDGAEAWQILQRQGADIVVTDIEMPRMDGFTLTDRIRRSERFRSIPVVLLTARETEQDKARGLQLGADAYMLKSAFDQRQLLEAIAQLA